MLCVNKKKNAYIFFPSFTFERLKSDKNYLNVLELSSQ